MKQVSEMPTSGQFVAVWGFNGEIFTDNFIYLNGKLFALGVEKDLTEMEVSFFIKKQPEYQTKYFIAE